MERSPFSNFEKFAPVSDQPDDTPEAGTGLCLSGGGYRAMLFHVGATWRLFEAGILQNVNRISSVSGGSLTAGLLGFKWSTICNTSDVTVFQNHVVRAIRSLSSKTIDIPSVVLGLLWRNPAYYIAKAYERYLYGNAKLQDLPDSPRFVINSTNLQSGVLFRFSKPYAYDYRVGKIENPDIRLSAVVAASSAFPPFLSPYVLETSPSKFTSGTGTDLQGDAYRSEVVLTDGGVYDNLGLETVWKNYSIVFVSDGGGGFPPKPRPHRNWLLQSVRVLNVIDNQVRSLRKRQVIESFKVGLRKGAYWGIRTNVADYPVVDPAFRFTHEQTIQLANIPTRLKRIDSLTQERLINWGYAVTDSALRSHFNTDLGKGVIPYPDAVWHG